MAKTTLGKVLMTPKGEYNAATSYDFLDVVMYGGSSFLVRKPVRGVAPYEGEYYTLLAQGGSNGSGGGDSQALLDHIENSDMHASPTEKSNWNAKAGTASPTFSGEPKAPTAPLGTNTTQLATTAFVLANSGGGGNNGGGNTTITSNDSSLYVKFPPAPLVAAKGDGVTDDTVYINAILQYVRPGQPSASRRKVKLGNGTFLVTGSINVPGYTKIEGDGRGATNIIARGTGAFAIFNFAAQTYQSTVSDMYISGNGFTTGVHFNNARECFLEGCSVYSNAIGIDTTQAWTNTISKCIISQNGVNARLNANSNAFYIVDCVMNNAKTNGLEILADAQGVRIVGCNFENSGHNGIYLNAGRAVSIRECYFENNGREGYSNGSTPGVKYSDIYAHGNQALIHSLKIDACMLWPGTAIGASVRVDRVSAFSAIGCTFSLLEAGPQYTFSVTNRTTKGTVIACMHMTGNDDPSNKLVYIA